MVVMAWLGGYLTGLWTEEEGEDGRWKVKIEALARSLCCVCRQDTLSSQCPSLAWSRN